MPAVWHEYYIWFALMFDIATKTGHHGLAKEIEELAHHEFPLVS